MYHLRTDTLAGLKLSSLFAKRNWADQSVKLAVSPLNAYMGSAGMAKPETEAFKFYYANHVFSLIAAKYDDNEPLPKEVAELASAYVKMSKDVVIRLAYYCLLITVREARHLYSSSSSVLAKIQAECGKPVSDFIKSNLSVGESSAVSKLRNSPPDTTLGNLVKGLVIAFNEGGWSHGYGGPKWGEVAETLRKMVTGEITLEAFADTAFTLAHNNGPIFNKGMLYHGYGHFIYKLLDVQRSGQVPQLYEEVSKQNLADPEIFQFHTKASAVFQNELGGYVDWFKVEGLGSKHKYEKEKNAQLLAHGASSFVSAKQKADMNKYYVGPNPKDFATAYQRQEAA